MATFKKQIPDEFSFDGLPTLDSDDPKKTYSKFFGVSYASEQDIWHVLTYHVNGNFWFITHDRDIFEVEGDGEIVYKEPHTHIYFYDGGRHTVSAVLKWFEGLKDDNGRLVNTFFRPATSQRGCLRYLVHLDDPEKAHYKLNEVHVSTYTAGSMLYDACSLSGNSSDRYYDVISRFASRQIDYRQACRECPELFFRNFNNAIAITRRFCFEMGLEDRFLEDDRLFNERNLKNDYRVQG